MYDLASATAAGLAGWPGVLGRHQLDAQAHLGAQLRDIRTAAGLRWSLLPLRRLVAPVAVTPVAAVPAR